MSNPNLKVGGSAVETGQAAHDTLAAAMLGMDFTDDNGNHDVQVISARIRDELAEMGCELQISWHRDIQARLQRAAKRLQDRIDELGGRHPERQRLEHKLDGVMLALSYFGDYQ